MNEDIFAWLCVLLWRKEISVRLERWIIHTLLSAAERETDAKILDELERLAK